MRIIGLSDDEILLYQTMIRRPSVTASELAEILGWGTDRVTGTLESLEHFSLLRRSWEVPGELTLINPEIGLGVLLAEREAELHRHQSEIGDARAAMARLVADYNKARETRGYVPAEQFTGLDAIRLSIEELVEGCTSEIMAFAPDGPQTRENMEASRPLDLALLARGVRLRSIYLDSIVNDASTLAYARWLSEQGGEVRTVPTLPTRVAIYDRRAVLVAADPEESGASAILVKARGVVELACALFEQVWERATVIGAPAPRDDEGLTGREREILRLLSEGNTDDAVARKLGISVRTARRQISDLAGRLDAQSRFQAGVRAAELGWVRDAKRSMYTD